MKKNPPTLLIFGGVAALAAGYYFMSKKKVANAATAPTRAIPTKPAQPGFFLKTYADGTKQCFSTPNNGLAPLSKCGIFPPPPAPTFRLVKDPSGAFACFDKNGAKAPLALCEGISPLEGMGNYVSVGAATPCCNGCAQGRGCSG